MGYSRLLCALDLADDNHRIIEKALSLAPREAIELLHACEHPITGYGELTGRNHKMTEHQIKQTVFPELTSLSKPYEFSQQQLHIKFGRPADTILEMANSINADLIIMGSHGHSGIRMLLGSTANSVVHSAECDVLTVRTITN